MKLGGIVLCGGKSSRMGLAKEALPFGNELMLPLFYVERIGLSGDKGFGYGHTDCKPCHTRVIKTILPNLT